MSPTKYKAEAFIVLSINKNNELNEIDDVKVLNKLKSLECDDDQVNSSVKVDVENIVNSYKDEEPIYDEPTAVHCCRTVLKNFSEYI